MTRRIRKPWRVSLNRTTGTTCTDHGSEAEAYGHIRATLAGNTDDLIRIDVEWHDWQQRRWMPYERLGCNPGTTTETRK